MSGLVKKGTFNIVRQFHLDDEKLKRIAEALEIPEAERDRIISAEIVISPPPTPPDEGSQPTRPSGGTPPSPTRRRRRRSE